MSVFTVTDGGVRPSPFVQEIFAASIFRGICSGQRLQQNSAWTLLYGSSAAAFSSLQLAVAFSKRLPTADHPKNAARNDVQV